MLKFFKESVKEFDHVVWPTNKETKNYFSIVTGVIVGLTVFLFIVSTVLSYGLFTAGTTIRGNRPVQLQNTSTKAPVTPTGNLKLDTNTTQAPATQTPAPAKK